ncbi:LPS export ABC transporter periplasmic protein LptC [Rhodobacter calidifons]|uniref:LPS export ABC transporter periplasmic protein LptC n=1 Tax=Rhodobacter calidifons TaxID=2715277 RepID=A0ABX0G3Y7_9RHOB|nr:LPS export ABC transporter periplasmic protein LptC [Rhodobacter calidifons]NHB75926.1 LPS export ABC transporter periplasmic protein LptC [Rhodobacter calidifons]
MARADRHTRVVGWLKVALPLAALAILSTLFLVARRIDPEAALPYAEVDVHDLAREPRMTAPTYAGTTRDGGALTLRADEARPAAEGVEAAASALRLELDTPDGARTELSAATARMDRAAQEVVLSGGVTVTTSTGYRLETEEVAARLDRTGLESRAPVTATGPVGEIRADRMELRQENPTQASYVLVFNGGVRLVYRPGG